MPVKPKKPSKTKTAPKAKASNKEGDKNTDTSNNEFWKNILEYSTFDDFWEKTIEDKIQVKLSDKNKDLLNKLSNLDHSDSDVST